MIAMKIDENTKVIGRIHSKPSPRGLNIYNPLFEELGINALYILFYNPDPKPLFAGIRNLQLAGAVTVGFETDPRLAELVDEFDDMAKYLNRVGFVTNKNGVLTGHVQSGEAMVRSISSVSSLSGKKLVIIGAGQVTKSLLFYISKQKTKPDSIEIYNRTVEKAEGLADEYSLVTKTGSLEQLSKTSGDILVNLSDLGGRATDDIFTEKVVQNFSTISDVIFETEETNLIKLAKKLKKKHVTGWDMFTYQGQIVLETILGMPISADVLKKHVHNGLNEVVK